MAETEVQVIGKKENRIKISINGTQLKQVENFIYLGGTIFQKLSCTKDVNSIQDWEQFKAFNLYGKLRTYNAGPQPGSILGVVWNPQNVNLLDPKSGLFKPRPPLTNTPFLAHFVAKSGPFGRFVRVRHTPAPPWLRACYNETSKLSYTESQCSQSSSTGQKPGP